MNCEEANQFDMVDYLNLLGFQPQKIRGSDYWYLSPLRDEKVPSFKIERNKNVWYDHGMGKGGSLIDFAIEYFHWDVSEALKKISSFHPHIHFKNIAERPLFHLLENSLLNHRDARETAIKIITAKRPISYPMLCRYLQHRRIEKSIADAYAYEVHFTAGKKEKLYTATGFKNNAGGYELRNEYFKGCSSQKYITYLDNKAKDITVFEGFFDFMSYQSLSQSKSAKLPDRPSNFLMLNSLTFFERSLLLMEKHQGIHLYLDRDTAGRKYTDLALKRSLRFTDESKLYNGYKDLNDLLTGKKMALKRTQRPGIRF